MTLLRGLHVIVLVLVVGASVPALTGSWVYDDFTMVGHPLMDGADDALSAFTHHSADYILYSCVATGAPPKAVGTTTYRPISLASLIATNAFFGLKPLAHHIVSLLLHLAVVTLLWLSIARIAPGRPWFAWFIAALFALHPALGEAFLWINARSDLLAGFALICWALVLYQRQIGTFSTNKRLANGAVSFALCAFGMMSKETVIPAAVTVWLSAHLVDSPITKGAFLSRFRALLPDTVGAVFALLLWVLLRERVFARTPAIDENLSWVFLLQTLLSRGPHLIARALVNLAVPMPRAMDSLVWSIRQPWTFSEITLSIAAAAGFVWLLISRQWRVAILILGAALALLPTAYVADFLWFGFDRYLYLPAILLCLALTLLFAKGSAERLELRLSSVVGTIVSTVILSYFAFTVFITAGYYQDEHSFMMSMVKGRPNDPSPYLLGAGRAIAKERYYTARGLLDSMPADQLPPVLIETAADRYRRAGATNKADALIKDFYAKNPQDPYAGLAMMDWLGERRDFAQALILAQKVMREPGFCRATKETLGTWEEGLLEKNVKEKVKRLKTVRCADLR